MSASAPQLGWGHVNINVRDLDRSIEFYRKLGFEEFIPGIPYVGLNADSDDEIPADPGRALGLGTGVNGRACIMQLDAGFPKIDLTELGGTEQRAPLENKDLGLVRLCLISEDLQNDYARLRGAGVEFISEPLPGKDGMVSMAVCVDPDGTLIEIIQAFLEKWPPLPGLNG